MADLLKDRCSKLLEALGLAAPDEIRSVEPLTGGVASDIAKVETDKGTYCAKFALAQLRVEAEWHAPVHRNAAEYAWLEFVHALLPNSAPKLYGRSATENGFIMEFLAGGDIRLWKSDLLQNGPRTGDAIKVAHALVTIHAASARPGFDSRQFQNQSDFYALRLEPYLDTLRTKHRDISDRFLALIESYESHAVALVHGDISPKNILLRGTDPIFLDAECATMGDPAFDIAFCLNHLLLKALHMPQHRRDLFKSARDFWSTYKQGVDWEDASVLEARVASLLPALFLARVDGKSPVEYLSDEAREAVRVLARPFIAKPLDALTPLFSELESQMK